jgi:uncharacterized protein YegP (UPF0339 family)
VVRYEIRRGSAYPQPFYCRAVSVANGQVLMTSETYRSKRDAVHVAELMRGSGGASIVDLT